MELAKGDYNPKSALVKEVFSSNQGLKDSLDKFTTSFETVTTNFSRQVPLKAWPDQ